MIGLPPYALSLGIRIVEPADAADAAAAGALLRLPMAEHLTGRPGFLHGGAIAGLLEIAAYAALREAITDDPARIKPIGVTVDYMRGGRAVTTYAAAIVVRLGRRIANVEAFAWQRDRETRIAAARMTMLLERSDR